MSAPMNERAEIGEIARLLAEVAERLTAIAEPLARIVEGPTD